jgi:hypothetical protein
MTYHFSTLHINELFINRQESNITNTSKLGVKETPVDAISNGGSENYSVSSVGGVENEDGQEYDSGDDKSQSPISDNQIGDMSNESVEEVNDDLGEDDRASSPEIHEKNESDTDDEHIEADKNASDSGMLNVAATSAIMSGINQATLKGKDIISDIPSAPIPPMAIQVVPIPPMAIQVVPIPPMAIPVAPIPPMAIPVAPIPPMAIPVAPIASMASALASQKSNSKLEIKTAGYEAIEMKTVAPITSPSKATVESDGPKKEVGNACCC